MASTEMRAPLVSCAPCDVFWEDADVACWCCGADGIACRWADVGWTTPTGPSPASVGTAFQL